MAANGFQLVKKWHVNYPSSPSLATSPSVACSKWRHGATRAIPMAIETVTSLDPSLLLATVLKPAGHQDCSIAFDWSKYALSGAFAGGCRALSRALTYPFDTIKTLEQSDASLRPKKVKYFRGLVLSVVSAIPANAFFFVTYYYLDQLAHCLAALQILTASLSELGEKMVISLIATLPQNAMKIPAEVIKQRAQIQPEIPLWHLIEETIEKEGWQGFYVGSGAQLLRELPYNAFQMVLFDVFRGLPVVTASFASWDSTVEAALLGLVAASLAAVLTQPADVVKTKLMTAPVESHHHTSSSSWMMNQPFLRACWEVYRSSGLGGFFAGLLPRLAIVSFGGMVYFYAAQIVEDSFA
eukprot:gene6286-6931_t